MSAVRGRGCSRPAPPALPAYRTAGPLPVPPGPLPGPLCRARTTKLEWAASEEVEQLVRGGVGPCRGERVLHRGCRLHRARVSRAAVAGRAAVQEPDLQAELRRGSLRERWGPLRSTGTD